MPEESVLTGELLTRGGVRVAAIRTTAPEKAVYLPAGPPVLPDWLIRAVIDCHRP
jgi:hypothetical protein